MVVYTILAIGLALFIRFFIAAPYVVQGASMEPTFHDWHYLIIDRITYDISEPVRGDVIVFNLPTGGNRSLIKRVIGLPGETVIVEGSRVRIVNDEHPQGFILDEPYLDPKNVIATPSLRFTLAGDQFFVLGDNRRVSADSRVWGALPREDIIGKVFIRLFPITAVGVFPGEERYQE